MDPLFDGFWSLTTGDASDSAKRRRHHNHDLIAHLSPLTTSSLRCDLIEV
jgi:hypothetical protein